MYLFGLSDIQQIGSHRYYCLLSRNCDIWRMAIGVRCIIVLHQVANRATKGNGMPSVAVQQGPSSLALKATLPRPSEPMLDIACG